MSKRRRRKRDRRPNIPPDTLRAAASTRVKQPLGSLQGSYDFDPDYSYVVKDLKRIGVLAGSSIILLIVISFFLR
ncbi:MAG: hypothetical protein KAS19_09325 [Anaerolineales bacterium]|nr:hypothetical protein [Anaerolineales bacterium]MCK4962677.1 hypothetical protein [Anaerolineales bacterium]